MPFYKRILKASRSHFLPIRHRGVSVPRDPKTLGEHLKRRRVQLGQKQAEAARILGISTVSLSRWELDKGFPSWGYQQAVIDYLGYDPFKDFGIQDPYGNETGFVAFSSAEGLAPIGLLLHRRRLELKLTVKECARKLGVDPKSVIGWEKGRHEPCRRTRERVKQMLGTSVTT